MVTVVTGAEKYILAAAQDWENNYSFNKSTQTAQTLPRPKFNPGFKSGFPD